MTNKLAKRDKFKSIGDKLAAYGKSFEQAGDTLIPAALEKFRVDEQERMVGKITQLLNHLRALRMQSDRINAEILLCESRLKQVHDGDITIDAAGTMHWKDGFYI